MQNVVNGAKAGEVVISPGQPAANSKNSGEIKTKIAVAGVCALALLVVGFALGLLAAQHKPVSARALGAETGEHAEDGAQPLKPGPWGELQSVPMSIAAPEDLIPVKAIENTTPHWFFRNYSVADLTRLLVTAGLSEADRNRWLGSDVVHGLPNGLDVTPTHDMSLALSPEARAPIVDEMARFLENRSQLYFFHNSTIIERFRVSRCSDQTIALFTRLTAAYRDYRVLADLPALLSGVTDYDEKIRLIKALTYQRTLLLRLHVKENTDITALSRYWGKSFFATDVDTILGSLARVQKGTWVDIVEMLPPIPSGLLYTFPLPDNPLNGTPVRKDCHWTAFNFFRDPPDPGYCDPNYVAEKLKLNYYPVPGDPRYGDVVLFSLPSGETIHSAVYLADDVVYTKNGDTAIHPWMLSTMGDLLQQYSFMAPEGQTLSIVYYRNKYY